jgi:hypothetical protein
MSGKSLAYRHRRKKFESPRRLPVAGFLNRSSGIPSIRNGGCRGATFLSPHFCSAVPWNSSRGNTMKKLLVAAVIAATFFSFKASAQERAGSAALGAVSGAVVLGPIGAVAGAFIGYTAGPAIAHSWGAGHSRSRRVTQANAGTEQQAAPKATPLPVAKPAEAVAAGKSTPPVQGFD